MKVLSILSLVLFIFSVVVIGFVIRHNQSNILLIRDYLNDTIVEPKEVSVDTSSYNNDQNKEVFARVILMSDSENDWSLLNDLVRKINEDQVDLVFHLGDITHLGLDSDLSTAKATLDRLPVKYYAIPGDRDIWKGGVNLFTKYFSSSYNFISYQNINFLLINNSDEYNGIDDKQFQFIKDHIIETDFILVHNPIYFEGSLISSILHKGMGQYSSKVDDQRKLLLELISSSDRVKAVFAGDQHIFSKMENSGVYYFTTSSLNTARSIGQPGVSILSIYEDQTFSVENVSLIRE